MLYYCGDSYKRENPEFSFGQIFRASLHLIPKTGSRKWGSHRNIFVIYLRERNSKTIVMKRISAFLQNINRNLLLIICMIIIVSLSCNKKNPSSSATPVNNMVNYTGSFIKASSPDSSQANGTVTATFNKTTSQLSYAITWHSLTSVPVAMHFHDSGPVIVQFSGFPVNTDGSFSGVATLSSSQANDLATGLIYAIIHTKNYTAGEILAYLFQQ